MTNAIIPNLTPIPETRSSQIAAMGYAEEMLYILFRRGGLYCYDEVTPEEWGKMLDLERPLTATFIAHIKGKKPYKKLDDGTEAMIAITDAVAQPTTKTARASAPQKSAGPGKVVAITKPAPKLTDAQQQMASDALHMRDEIMALTVDTVDKHSLAQRLLLELAERRQKVVNFFKPHKANAYKAWKDLCDEERRVLDPLEQADATLRKRTGEYTYMQLKLARERDEAARREAEAKAVERAKEETVTNTIAAAEELEAMGDIEGAEAVLNNPMPAEVRYDMPMPVQPAVAAVEGVGGRLAYEVTIFDLGLVPREYLVIDMDKTETEIARRAKQAQGRLQVPGVTIRETYAVRRTGGRR